MAREQEQVLVFPVPKVQMNLIIAIKIGVYPPSITIVITLSALIDRQDMICRLPFNNLFLVK